MKFLVITVLIFAFLHPAFSSEEVVYLTPDSSSACPSSRNCWSLDYFRQYKLHSYTFKKVDLKVVFLPGTHTLAASFEVSGLSQFSGKVVFTGAGGEKGIVIIQCKNKAGFVIGGSGSLTFEGLHFRDCGGRDEIYSTNPGQGLKVAYTGQVLVNRCIFTGTQEPYATFYSSSSETIFRNSVIYGMVEIKGSRYSIGRNSYNFTTFNCIFVGLKLEDLTMAKITSSLIKGSGLRIARSNAVIYGVNFVDNFRENCAAILAEDCVLNITYSNIRNNTALNHAGICAIGEKSNLFMKECDFKYNKVIGNKGSGGLFATGKINLTRVYFFDNVGINGGALSLANANLVASNLYFFDNIAMESGGAVYAKSRSRAVLNRAFLMNNTDSNGRAIVSTDGSTISTPECSGTDCRVDTLVEVLAHVMNYWQQLISRR